jgi:hypothetical protein
MLKKRTLSNIAASQMPLTANVEVENVEFGEITPRYGHFFWRQKIERSIKTT